MRGVWLTGHGDLDKGALARVLPAQQGAEDAGREVHPAHDVQDGGDGVVPLWDVGVLWEQVQGLLLVLPLVLAPPCH